MKKFLIKIGFFTVLTLGSILLVFLRADGTSDPFYKKFTSGKQSSLLLGSSRTSFAIIPELLNDQFPGINSYNYAFTYNTSPYGPTYLKSIQQKLDTTQTAQLFILCVDPWVLSIEGDKPNDTDNFDEKDLFLGELKNVTTGPNLEYLIHHYSEPYIKMLYNKSPMTVQEDGFLRLDVLMSEKAREAKKMASLENYEQKKTTYQFSNARLSYLKETIEYLQKYGDTYLVRLPIDQEFLALENDFMPTFDRVIDSLSNAVRSPYINLTSQASQYIYSDGHHAMPASAEQITLTLASQIKTMKQ